MAKVLGIVVRRAPFGTINASEAVRHAAGGVTFGLATALILVEDGVEVARAVQRGERIGFTSLAAPLGQYTKQEGSAADGSPLRGRVVAHGPALALRGLKPSDLVDGVEIVDDEGLARLLGECDAVLTY
ncbi:MAG: DsrE family protein [Chloroflexota bacterium]